MKVCRSGLGNTLDTLTTLVNGWSGLDTPSLDYRLITASTLAVPVLLYVMITRVSGSSHIEKAKLRTANASTLSTLTQLHHFSLGSLKTISAQQ